MDDLTQRPIDVLKQYLTLRTEDRSLYLQAPVYDGFITVPTFNVSLSGRGRRAWDENMHLTVEQARALALWLVENLPVRPDPPPAPVPLRWSFWRRLLGMNP